MLNISFNPINNSNVSFGARYPINYLTVEKIIKKYTSLGLKSATDLEMRFPNPLEKDISSQKEFFVNNSNQKIYLDKNNKIIDGYVRKKQLLTHKISSIQNFIEYYRAEILPKLYFKSEDDYFLAMQHIVKKHGFANCFECAALMHFELNKLGIPNRMVQDLDIDHCFVVVNRNTPFVSYKDKKHGEFVADLWLKKTYKSTQEAQIDFNNRLDKVSNCNLLIDSPACSENILNRPLSKKEKEYNEKLLSSLTDDWNFLEKYSKTALINGKFEEFKTTSSEEIIKKYSDDLSRLHYYYARNRRKNKIT